MSKSTTNENAGPHDEPVPVPREPTPEGQLPHPLTFFLTRDERRLVLKALAPIRKDRARSLLIALRIDHTEH